MDKKEFDYKAYKLEATKDDVKKIESKMKIRWYEHILFIGPIFYSSRMSIEMARIDSGPLRKQIMISSSIYMKYGLGIIFSLFMLISSYAYYLVLKRAVMKTKELIEEGNI